MDPQKCLLGAQEALEAGRIQEALELCAYYRAWRHDKGFEPENGDACCTEIERLCEQTQKG